MSFDLNAAIRRIPDHPTPGTLFFDVMPLFENAEGLAYCSTQLVAYSRTQRAGAVLGIEARGLILGGVIARELNAGLAVARKPGKLPGEKLSQSYELEYGADELQLHIGAIAPGARVVVHDDLLATGGTAEAACKLVERSGGHVAGVAFVVELDFLPGRERLENQGYDVHSLVVFDSERMA
ncbi:MAG: adenine phosphoribosyltransferase [Thermoleophilia bacterium]|nr:adenine phosphoribosyltransferase [Thermoleophilia bacterium]MDH3724225.1 adenine phosphoribosyltransferase [Thermoleophilia bacterium]